MKTINIKFPLTDNTEKNSYYKMNRITKDAFSSDLLLLLLTEKGERYYYPNYGTNLLKYIFEPNDNISAQEIEQQIKKTVSLYIPNLTIKKVEFNRPEESDVQLNVKIKFTYSEDTFTENGELDLNF
jgi:phage baseplate assembly protein W